MSFIPLSQAKRINFSAPKPPTEKKFEKNGITGTYSRTYINYSYKDETGKSALGPAMFEVDGDILIKKTDYGTITATIHLTKQEDVNGAVEANAGALLCVAQQKGPLKMPNFNPENPPDGMRTVYFRETDKNGVPVEGKEPMIYLHTDKSSEFRFLTCKTDESGKKIYETPKIDNPNILAGKILTGSIVFCIRDIYKGSNATMIQSYIRVITIVSMRDASTVDVLKSSSFLDRYLKSENVNANMAQLQAQMQALSISQPESLLLPSNSTSTQSGTTQSSISSQTIPVFAGNPQSFIPGIPSSPTPSTNTSTTQPIQTFNVTSQQSQQAQQSQQTIPTIPTANTNTNSFQQPTSFTVQQPISIPVIAPQNHPLSQTPQQLQGQQSQQSQQEQLQMFLAGGNPTMTSIPQLNIRNL